MSEQMRQPVRSRGALGRRRHERRQTDGGSDRFVEADAGVPAIAASTRPTPDDPYFEPALLAGPAPWAPLLLGATTAMVVSGLVVRFRQLFASPDSPDATVAGTVVGVSLIGLAIGVRVPQRLALWVGSVAWRRVLRRAAPPGVTQTLPAPTDMDRPLYWLVLSVLALAGGVATALLPLAARVATATYAWMNVHFVWSVGPLAVAEAILLLGACVVPLTLLGMAISCAHHLSCPDCRWNTRATGWLLVGAAGGAVAAGWALEMLGRADLVLVAAALPVLLVALGSAISGTSHGTSKAEQRAPAPLPISTDRWPTLLRAGVVAVGGGGACAMVVWLGQPPQDGGLSGVSAASMLLVAGVGVLIACGSSRCGFRSVGGFGFAIATAGIVVAGGALLARSSGTLGTTATRVAALAGMLSIGFATAYGRQTLLVRVASRSSTGAETMARTLVCAALTAWIAAPLALRVVGPPATLIMLALSMIALGGVLVIHEPTHSTRTRRLRLCAVFACVAALIAATWSPQRHATESLDAVHTQAVSR